MIDWLAFKILILFYKTDFFLIHNTPLLIIKISKSCNLAYLSILEAQKQFSKFQNFGLGEIKVIETQKCTQALAWPPLFCWLFSLPCQLWGVIIFEQLISLCFLSPIYLSSGKVSSESDIGYVPTFEILVHLTWNDPISQTKAFTDISTFLRSALRTHSNI